MTLAPIVTDVPPSAPVPTPPASAPRLLPLRALLAEWDADALARADARATGRALGPISGLGKLDRELGGALVPGLHILHGVPGVGKTAFALQIAASCGCPCLYVSCEMSALELLRRITARVTSTFLGKFKSGELAPAESAALVRRAVAAGGNLSLLDATTARLAPWGDPAADPGLLEFADAAKNADTANPHLLIVVDSLHSWAESYYESLPEYEALNAGLSALRQIGSRLSCPVLAVAERNRASMKEGGLSAGAGSRKIEYGAESVIDLDTEKDARDDEKGEKPITLRIAKNRNGAAGKTLHLRFHGAMQRYTEAD